MKPHWIQVTARISLHVALALILGSYLFIAGPAILQASYAEASELTPNSCDLNADGTCDAAENAILEQSLGENRNDPGSNPLADADADNTVTDVDQEMYFPAAGPGEPTLTFSTLQATGITATSATISWSTNLPATSQVEYRATGGLSQTTTLDPALVGAHNQALSGLTLGTDYQYRAISTADGKTAHSNVQSFSTASLTFSTLQATGITSTSATISWSTNLPATSQIEYRATDGLSQTTTLDTALVAPHIQALSGLTAGIEYLYRAIGIADGKAAHSDVRSFTTIPLQPLTLTVTKAGTGTGTVTSAPAGIDCGATCSANYSNGSQVILTATAASGSTFTGWSGDCSGNGVCQVTLSAAKSVTAAFNITSSNTFVLAVSKSGSGEGTISSAPAGIICGSTCSASYTAGATVTLTAAPATGSTFGGWSGACSGTGTCQVTMDAAKNVAATFQHVNAGVVVGPGLGPSGEKMLISTLTARSGCGAIDSIQLGETGRSFNNAKVGVALPAGGPSNQTTGFTYTPPAGTTSVTITIQRTVQSGGATVSPILLHDGCGDWRTFVGGGPDAFR